MKYTFIFIALSLTATISFAQEFSSSISEARSSYKSGNLDDARFALEQAMHTLDQEIGKEILKVLPTSLQGAEYKSDEDNVVGTNLGFAGLFVDRNYYADEKSATIQIIGDSPLMAGINALLALPNFVTSGDSDQKRIKVDGYKALLTKNTRDDGVESYSLQIPANATLITMECLGYSEAQVTTMANQIPVTQVVKLAQ
ncbi:MAG: hypothetical protein U5K79_21375 [Cyclobacteriaceae bacterium]|nr:hypothetical protein [Cyclobacteriaceae bacterium]